MSDNAQDAITELDNAASYCRARAAVIVARANDWGGYDFERDTMLKSAAEMLRDAETFAARSNMLSMFGLDYVPRAEDA